MWKARRCFLLPTSLTTDHQHLRRWPQHSMLLLLANASEVRPEWGEREVRREERGFLEDEHGHVDGAA